MSEIAVIYTSKYGSAKQYAQWICEETGADIFDATDCKVSELHNYDVIVYGGGVHAGGIEGIDFLKKNFRRLQDKRIIVFAVGINVFTQETQQQCREINFVKKLKDLPCYFFGGKYEPDKVKGIDEKIMGFVRRMLSKKLSRSEDEEHLYKAITEGTNLLDKSQIKTLVDVLNSI